jgi:hypothetical protein
LLFPSLKILYNGPKKVANNKSVIVFARLFFFVFLLLLFALAITLFLLELFFPELVGGVAIDVGEDDLKDVRVPFYWLAFDTFFDVLR